MRSNFCLFASSLGLIFILLAWPQTSSALAPAKMQMRVMIDPGHGGSDSGAVRGSIREAELALKVSQLVKSLLEKNPEFTVALTRTEDVNLSLQQRVSVAEKSQADVLVSLHTNAATDPRAKGFEIYFQNHLPADEDLMFLANVENQLVTPNDHNNSNEDPSKKGDIAAIVEDLKRSYRMQASHLLTKQISSFWTRGNSSPIRQAPFFVLAKSTMPSVLIELGFISNPKESEKLSKPEYQKEIAERIYKGLVQYKELMDKGQRQSLN
jgi:N-acetylmuramoyl-L-alanine amidase